MIAVEGIPQPVLDHGVDHLERAHLHAVAQMLGVRRHAHGLLAAGDHDLAVAVQDRLIAERDRAQARTAQLVDAPGGAFDRNAGGDRGLPRRVLALTGGQDLPHDDFGDAAAFDAGALQRRLNRDLAELMRRQIGEGPVEGADRRAGGADDDDVVLHPKLLLRSLAARKARYLALPHPRATRPALSTMDNLRISARIGAFLTRSARVAALRRMALPRRHKTVARASAKPAMLRLWAGGT